MGIVTGWEPERPAVFSADMMVACLRIIISNNQLLIPELDTRVAVGEDVEIAKDNGGVDSPLVGIPSVGGGVDPGANHR
jgi:hypothetical protein